MDFHWTEDDQTFADSFRRFCQNEIEPATAQADEAECLPREHYKKLGSAGYLGLLHSRSVGGQEASVLQATLAQTILAESCGSTFFSAGASTGLFGLPIADHGTPEQQARYLPSVIRGEKIGALAVTEPDAGSDVSSLKTVANAVNGSIELSGQKTYITNAPNCDYALVLARYVEGGKDKGLTSFIVDMNTPGISRGKPMKKMGLRASPTGEIFFDKARISADSILSRPGQGFRITMSAFNAERVALGAYCVGVMAACLADSIRYSKVRKSFGRPISKHQSVAFMLADMKTRYEAAKLYLYETAWLVDQSRAVGSAKLMHNGKPIDLPARAASLKLLASTYAREVTNMAVQVHGGAGYMEEFRVCRMYRDIKIAEIGGGTSEIQKQIIARSEEKRVGRVKSA